MEDAVQIGLVDAAEEAVGPAMTHAEQSELAHLRAENERLRQSHAAKDERIQKLEDELVIERQQKLAWTEIMRGMTQTMNDMCATTDPKVWEQRLADYLSKVSCSSAAGLRHPSLSGSGHHVASIVHPCFERLENHR